MESVYNYTLKNLEKKFVELGEKPFRAKQVFEWIYVKEVYDYDLMTNLSQSLRDKLKTELLCQLLEIYEKQVSADGTVKYLLRLDDGGLIETVLMIHPYGHSLCVTSQLGCNMACGFCASGLLKKQRNLSADEMVRQILTVQNDLQKKYRQIIYKL